MYQISREKMPERLAAVAKEMDLFLPVQNNGITNFGFWTEDADLDLDTLKTVKSPKDAFFPQSEILYSCYQKANKTSIEPAALKDAPFAIFGVRPVSYTHLDVYKRQLDACLKKQGGNGCALLSSIEYYEGKTREASTLTTPESQMCIRDSC